MNFINPPMPSPDWAYFLDVDGTLIELAPTPDSIRVEQRVLNLITQTYRICGGALALVSGRSLADLDSVVGLIGIPASGQHGLEWRDSASEVQRSSAVNEDIQSMLPHALRVQRKFQSILVENKGMSIAMHYRSAPRLGGHLHRTMRELVAASGRPLEVQAGKRVVEIKPKGSDKGKAIELFMGRQPFFGRRPVFIGDDTTDEHGFDAVNRMGGISVKVGRGATNAHYRLPDVSAVLSWLRIVELTTPQ